MANLLQTLVDAGVATPPKWLASNTHYLVVMGSRAYGVARPDKSDYDLVGFALPPKHVIFPHLTGAIPGFGTKPPGFEQYLQGDVKHADREYDLRVMSIVKYFNLSLGCNPDVLDSVFVPEDCVLHSTRIGEMVRERRGLFLNKGDIWRAFKGYSASQMHKLETKTSEGKRAADVAREGFDRKFAYHGVRLLLEAEQLLTTGTMDFRHNQQLLADIRRDGAEGGMSLQDVLRWVADKKNELQTAFENSQLPEKPQEVEVQQLLYDCLEEHFGSLEAVQPRPGRALATLQQIRALMDESGLPI